eukprot:GHVT01087335.1.p1 GENE.GHVT01087335.1~~GHVT01087335.1.p1  ORF type:complete len:443 (+),score=88.41 GHVT01087335.1:476-1804(+)
MLLGAFLFPLAAMVAGQLIHPVEIIAEGCHDPTTSSPAAQPVPPEGSYNPTTSLSAAQPVPPDALVTDAVGSAVTPPQDEGTHVPPQLLLANVDALAPPLAATLHDGSTSFLHPAAASGPVEAAPANHPPSAATQSDVYVEAAGNSTAHSAVPTPQAALDPPFFPDGNVAPEAPTAAAPPVSSIIAEQVTASELPKVEVSPPNSTEVEASSEYIFVRSESQGSAPEEWLPPMPSPYTESDVDPDGTLRAGTWVEGGHAAPSHAPPVVGGDLPIHNLKASPSLPADEASQVSAVDEGGPDINTLRYKFLTVGARGGRRRRGRGRGRTPFGSRSESLSSFSSPSSSTSSRPPSEEPSAAGATPSQLAVHASVPTRRLAEGDLVMFGGKALLPGRPRKWKKVQCKVGTMVLPVWETIPDTEDVMFAEYKQLIKSGAMSFRRTGRL